MQAFECRGLWYLPDTESPRVAGTLYVSSGGEMRLSLMGSLGPAEGLRESKEHAIVLGLVDGPFGNNVTLTNCYNTVSQFGSHVGVREEYRVRRGLLGAHLSRRADFAFRRVRVRATGLGAWTHSLSGFRPGGLGGIHLGEEAPLLSYAMPGPVGGPIPEGEISLEFGLTLSSIANGYSYTEQPDVIITCDPPLTEGEIYQRFATPLQNLMTFVCDRAQEVEVISLWCEDILTPLGENPEIRLIVSRVFPEVQGEKDELIHPHELLFTLAEIECEFASFIERWCRVMVKYSDACAIFFGLQYGPPAYLDFTFLGVIESLSLYYTRREDGVAHRDHEDNRLKEIVGKLSPTDAEWIRNHIWVRPFPPLDDILRRLIKEHANAMNPLLRTEDKFAAEVINTANYFLRRDPEASFVASRGTELYWLTAKLRILMKLCLLRELGFSEDKACSFIANDRLYKQLCQMISATSARENG